jgi:hypothetical protein
MLLVVESAATSWLVEPTTTTTTTTPALLHQLLQQSISGMNFSLHACSVYYFIFHRSLAMVAVGKGKSSKAGHNTLWSCALGTGMLGCVSLAQFVCCCMGNAGGPVTRNVLLFNLIRGSTFLLTSCSFISFPSKEMWKMIQLKHVTRQQRRRRRSHTKEDRTTPRDRHPVPPKQNDTAADLASSVSSISADTSCGAMFIPGLSNLWTFDCFEKSPQKIQHEQQQDSLMPQQSSCCAASRADVLSRCAFYTYIALAVYVTVEHSQYVSSSAVLVAGTGADEYDLGHHSLSYGLTYHFMFITFGYALRGVREMHGGYLMMGAMTTLCFSICGCSTVVRLLCLAPGGVPVVGVLIFVLTSSVNGCLGVSLWKTHNNATRRREVSEERITLFDNTFMI